MRFADLIEQLGGVAAVAALCRVSPQAVSKWRRYGIPVHRFDTLLLADDRLTTEDLDAVNETIAQARWIDIDRAREMLLVSDEFFAGLGLQPYVNGDARLEHADVLRVLDRIHEPVARARALVHQAALAGAIFRKRPDGFSIANLPHEHHEQFEHHAPAVERLLRGRPLVSPFTGELLGYASEVPVCDHPGCDRFLVGDDAGERTCDEHRALNARRYAAQAAERARLEAQRHQRMIERTADHYDLPTDTVAAIFDRAGANTSLQRQLLADAVAAQHPTLAAPPRWRGVYHETADEAVQRHQASMIAIAGETASPENTSYTWLPQAADEASE